MNLALIGLGRWGSKLLPKLLDHKSVGKIYCFDIDRVRVDRVVQEYPSARPVGDFESVLNDSEIDAVVIATPVGTHYPLAKGALEHGKHVLVEKPLTNRRDDARRLVELAEKHAVKLMVDHITVYSGPVRSIKKLIASGTMGKLFHLDAIRAGLGIIQPDVSVVWDLAVHEFALIDHVFGEMPWAVSATGSAFYGHLEEIAHATLFWKSGLVAHVHVSWLSPIKTRKMMICGMRKMLLFDDTLSDNKILLFDRGVEGSGSPGFTYREGGSEAIAYDRQEPLVAMVEEFVRSIDENRAPLTSGSVGLRTVELLEAVEKSIKQHGLRVVLS